MIAQHSSVSRLVASCGLAVVGLALAGLSSTAYAQSKTVPGSTPAVQPEQGGKIPVKTAADLPVYTYKIEGKASDFVMSDAPFKAFKDKVKADLTNDLAKYDIQDPSTLQGMYGLLQNIAMLDGKYEEAVGYTEKIRALEKKESRKLMAGQALAAYAAAKRGGTFDASVFKQTLKQNVGALPWDVVREDVVAAKGRSEMMSKELIIGQLKGGIDPVVEQSKGELSSDLARGLISLRMAIDVMLPVQPLIGEVYTGLMASNVREMKDNWTAKQVTLTEKDKGTPVVIAVWDSGVDVKLFEKQLFVNAKETVNGKDDDGNGFVDDVNGIAYDLENLPTPELLFDTKELKNSLSLVEDHTKGMSDVQAAIDSPEATALKNYMRGLKSDQVKNFVEDLGLFGNYSHGTHVAGIAAEGNPFARVLPVRITFDYREIPLYAPSEELSKRNAKAAIDIVNYMKAAGVRVVNMSWGGSYKSIESALEMKGVGGSPEERAALAKKYFEIEKVGLETAMKSAPEILFIAAAGNSNNDNAFEQFVPSGLNLPNMLTVGAVDKSGKPTGFTTFGKNVQVYSNGFEVESYVPGGKRFKYSGTSMAAPNAANLAGKMFALKPSLTVAEAIELIKKGSDPMEGRSELLVTNPKKTLEMLKK